MFVKVNKRRDFVGQPHIYKTPCFNVQSLINQVFDCGHSRAFRSVSGSESNGKPKTLTFRYLGCLGLGGFGWVSLIFVLYNLISVFRERFRVGPSLKTMYHRVFDWHSMPSMSSFWMPASDWPVSPCGRPADQLRWPLCRYRPESLAPIGIETSFGYRECPRDEHERIPSYC